MTSIVQRINGFELQNIVSLINCEHDKNVYENPNSRLKLPSELFEFIVMEQLSLKDLARMSQVCRSLKQSCKRLFSPLAAKFLPGLELDKMQNAKSIYEKMHVIGKALLSAETISRTQECSRVLNRVKSQEQEAELLHKNYMELCCYYGETAYSKETIVEGFSNGEELVHTDHKVNKALEKYITALAMLEEYKENDNEVLDKYTCQFEFTLQEAQLQVNQLILDATQQVNGLVVNRTNKNPADISIQEAAEIALTPVATSPEVLAMRLFVVCALLCITFNTISSLIQ